LIDLFLLYCKMGLKGQCHEIAAKMSP
jgi:hypothetical protein